MLYLKAKDMRSMHACLLARSLACLFVYVLRAYTVLTIKTTEKKITLCAKVKIVFILL